MIASVFQASGITLMCLGICGISCSSALSISAYTLSSPGALPFFNFMIASLTSWMVMGPSLTSMFCSASLMSGSVGGSYWLSIC